MLKTGDLVLVPWVLAKKRRRSIERIVENLTKLIKQITNCEDVYVRHEEVCEEWYDIVPIINEQGDSIKRLWNSFCKIFTRQPIYCTVSFLVSDTCQVIIKHPSLQKEEVYRQLLQIINKEQKYWDNNIKILSALDDGK